MANPLPFASASNDTIDWVKAVTPVTVTGGGSTTTISSPQPTASNNFWTTISGTSSNNGFGWNDGQTHIVCGISLAMTITAFTGTPPYSIALYVETESKVISLAQLQIGIESFPASGVLPTEQVTVIWPNGVLVPAVSIGTYGLIWNSLILTGSGSITIQAGIAAQWV